MTGRSSRGLGGRAGLVVFVAMVGLAIVGVVPVAAAPTPAPAQLAPSLDATSALTLSTSSSYTLDPAKRRVVVSVAITATNHHPDTVIRTYYFDHASLAVLPDTTAFSVTAVGSKAHPTVRVASRSSKQTLLSIGFGKRLGRGASLQLRLRFEIRDRGGLPNREVRIGSALATFPVWAFGSSNAAGGPVSVVMPSGYHVEIQGGPLTASTGGSSGAQVFRSGPLAHPLAFFAYVLADRPGAYRETPLRVTVAGAPLSVVVRAWQDDAAFGKRTTKLLKSALPRLGSAIGIPVPMQAGGSAAQPLAIQEAVTRGRGGYAALFDAAQARIEAAYDASPAVVVHEAAHAWFNGSLVADRWAAEGFASYYAANVAPALHLKSSTPKLTGTLQAARIPLNAWMQGASRNPRTDAYAFVAARLLASEIAQRAGADGLTAVWKAAAAGEMADQPLRAGSQADTDAPPAGGEGAGPDWRTLLDLLETRTNATYDDLWRTWVVRPQDVALLDARTQARAAYAALLADAGDWAVPREIRVALDRWQFDSAMTLIGRARTILAGRPTLAADAARINLQLPDRLRAAFEGPNGLAAAENEMGLEHQAMDRIAADASTRPSAPTIVTTVGLLGEKPESGIDASRAAFAGGDIQNAVVLADQAAATWQGAEQNGRLRLGLLALALAFFGITLLAVTRRPRRRRRQQIAVARGLPMARPVGDRSPRPGGPKPGGRG